MIFPSQETLAVHLEFNVPQVMRQGTTSEPVLSPRVLLTLRFPGHQA